MKKNWESKDNTLVKVLKPMKGRCGNENEVFQTKEREDEKDEEVSKEEKSRC